MITQTQLLRKHQLDGFDEAVSEWLSGETSGHFGPYMYTDDNDDSRWKNGHSAASYYLGRDDKAAFDLAVKDLGLSAEVFLDLGPGGEASVAAKSLPVMRALGARSYYPVDLSPALAGDALATVKKTAGAEGSAIIADFFKHIPGKKDNALIAIMGGTIGNLETHADPAALRDRLAGIFALYRNVVGKNSSFLVSFDANDNGREIVDCYDNPQLAGLIRSCIDRAIDTSMFDYYVSWTPDNYQLAMGLRAKRDRIVKFEGGEFAIERGECLPVLNSYRFPIAFVKTAAAGAGWKHEKTWTASGRVHYLLFKAA